MIQNILDLMICQLLYRNKELFISQVISALHQIRRQVQESSDYYFITFCTEKCTGTVNLIGSLKYDGQFHVYYANIVTTIDGQLIIAIDIEKEYPCI